MENTAADIMRKIRALLSRTVENGATESEAAAALRLAQRLLDKHNLTMAEVDAHTAAGNAAAAQRSRIVQLYPPLDKRTATHPQWRITVAQAIAQLYDCKTGYTRGGPIFIGAALDVEVAQEIYYWVLGQIDAIWTAGGKAVATSAAGPDSNPRTVFTQFHEGLASRLYSIARDQKTGRAAAAARAVATEEGEREVGERTTELATRFTALVVVKEKRIKDYMKTAGFRSRSSTGGRGQRNAGARTAGAQAAAGVRLRREIQ